MLEHFLNLYPLNDIDKLDEVEYTMWMMRYQQKMYLKVRNKHQLTQCAQKSSFGIKKFNVYWIIK